MTPVLVADGPGAAGIVRLGDERVVGTLAVGAADRVDRGEVDHVEAEPRDAGQRALGVTEGAVPCGIAGGGPGEELVPGGEPGLAPVRADPVLALGAGQAERLAVGGHQLLQLRRERRADARPAIGRGVRQQRGEVRQAMVVVASRVGLGLAHLVGAFEQLRGDILPGAHLLLQRAAPGGEPVHPSFDREPPLADPIQGQRRVPAVVFEGIGHRHGQRPALARREVENPRGEEIVSVGEDVGTDAQPVAHQPLHRMPSVSHGRRDVADDQVG